MGKIEFDYTIGPPQVVVTVKASPTLDSRGFEAICTAVADYPGIESAEWLSTEGDKLLVTFSEERNDVRVSDMRSRLGYFLRQLGANVPAPS